MKEKKVKRFLAITMFVLLAFIFCSGTFVVKSSVAAATLEMNNVSMQKNAIIANDSNEANDSLTKMNKKDSLRLQLIEDVNIHIRRNFRIHDSNLPMYLVEYSLKYDIDLCFMMAQTQLETNFGTLGAGREKSRRSLFGVYTKKYTSYEYAIDDWCNLLNKSYLGKGRTEEHLMNSYTSHSGKRYVENPSYEISLKST